MHNRTRLWAISAVVYVVFFVWYTDFDGPLTTEEIDTFVANLRARNADAENLAHLEGFLRADTGRQFLMLNAIDLSDRPPNVAGAEAGENADQLMARYMNHMLPALLQRASHPVVIGDATYNALDLVGIDGAEQWTMGALVRYRSRRSFMEIVASPAIGNQHAFKLAALDKTIAYPIETTFYPGDLRLLMGLLLLCITALLDIVLFRRTS